MCLFLKLRPFFCLSTGSRNLLQGNIRKISLTATNALQVRKSNVTSSIEEKCRRTDDISTNYQLIYRAPMEYYMKVAKNLSTLTAGTVAAIAAYKWMFNYKLIPMTYELNIGNLVAHESDIWWFAGAFVLVNLAMRLFVAKYPLRIYRNEDKYVAVYDSQLPFRTAYHSFNRGDVAAIQQYFNPWSHCMYRLGKRSSLLLIDFFKTPSEFHQMFGLK